MDFGRNESKERRMGFKKIERSRARILLTYKYKRIEVLVG